MKGNAPDHKRLMERREAYRPNIIPAGGLLLPAGADVQSYGIFVEVVAFAEDRQSWSVTATFFEGPTDNPQQGAWLLLEEFFESEFADAFGVLRKIEALAVDAGYRTNQVLEWCRRHPNAYAIKGVEGRGVPAISAPVNKSVNKRGKKKRFGAARSWPVGTWPLKAEFYGNLYKSGLKAGEAYDPPGYCHFHQDLGEEYFQQITAEYFKQSLVKGKLHEEWLKRRPDNHFLDCRIYAMAMAEHLGLSTMSKEAWAKLRASREPELITDLLSPPSHQMMAADEKPVTIAEPEKELPKQPEKENRWKRRK
jgi:phage terminase large subunit GpA-like protein